MIAEYKKNKEDRRLLRLSKREKLRLMSSMLDEVLKRPEFPEAILPSVRLQRNLDEANLRRRAIQSKYVTKAVLYKELKAALATHAKRSEIRKIKMKLKKNKLPIILEESTDEIVMEQKDIDELDALDEKIEALEGEKMEGEEREPWLNQAKIDASRVIENEMQMRRTEYVMQRRRDAM